MSAAAPYVSGIIGLVGVVVGAGITQGVAWWQKRKRHRAYWSALGAETDLCAGYAQSYLKDGVIAPLYRLSTVAYTTGFPALLGDGAVQHEEALAVLGFYNIVDQINRGLEQANDALVAGTKTDQSVKESMRLDLKCDNLLKDAYPRVHAAIDAHIRKPRT